MPVNIVQCACDRCCFEGGGECVWEFFMAGGEKGAEWCGFWYCS